MKFSTQSSLLLNSTFVKINKFRLNTEPDKSNNIVADKMILFLITF